MSLDGSSQIVVPDAKLEGGGSKQTVVCPGLNNAEEGFINHVFITQVFYFIVVVIGDLCLAEK